jgi:hypothetical protein
MRELSRLKNPLNLLHCVQHSQLPEYTDAHHSCAQCLELQDKCSHTCCREWFSTVGRKHGFLPNDGYHKEKDGIASRNVAQGIVLSTTAPSNSHSLIKSPSSLVQESNFKSQKCHKVRLRHPEREPPPNHSATMESSQGNQRVSTVLSPITSWLPLKSFVYSESAKRQLQRIKKMCQTIQPTTFHSSLQPHVENFKEGCTDRLKSWKLETHSHHAMQNLATNIRYAATVLGHHATQSLTQSARVCSTDP